MRNVRKTLDEKPEGKRPIGITKRRWEDNIKKDFMLEVFGV
jgi:hypothetical protein